MAFLSVVSVECCIVFPTVCVLERDPEHHCHMQLDELTEVQAAVRFLWTSVRFCVLVPAHGSEQQQHQLWRGGRAVALL